MSELPSPCPVAPGTPSSLCLLSVWVRCWECNRPKNGPMQVGMVRHNPPAPDRRQPHGVREGCCTLRGSKNLGSRAAHPHNVVAILAPVDGVSASPVGRMRLFLPMPSLSGQIQKSLRSFFRHRCISTHLPLPTTLNSSAGLHHPAPQAPISPISHHERAHLGRCHLPPLFAPHFTLWLGTLGLGRHRASVFLI